MLVTSWALNSAEQDQPSWDCCYATGDKGIPHTVVAWDLVLIFPEGGQALTLASWELLEIKVNPQLDTIEHN